MNHLEATIQPFNLSNTKCLYPHLPAMSNLPPSSPNPLFAIYYLAPFKFPTPNTTHTPSHLHPSHFPPTRSPPRQFSLPIFISSHLISPTPSLFHIPPPPPAYTQHNTLTKPKPKPKPSHPIPSIIHTQPPVTSINHPPYISHENAVFSFMG